MDDVGTALLLDAFEAMDDGMAIYDSSRRLLGCNDTLREMLAPVRDLLKPGAGWEDLLQACAHRGVYASAASADAEWRAQATSDADPARRRVEVWHADGRLFDVRFQPLARGGFLVSRTDITERRAAEVQTSASEEMLRAIADGSPSALIALRLADGTSLYRSPDAIALFGAGDLPWHPFTDQAPREALLEALGTGGVVTDHRMSLPGAGGASAPAAINARLIEIDRAPAVLAEVTILSKVEDRETLIQKVVEACPAPILMTELKTGRILLKSPELDRLFIASDNTVDFYAEPSDRVAFVAALRRDGEVRDFTTRFRGPDGLPFPAAVSARLIDVAGEEVIVSFSRDLRGEHAMQAELDAQRDQLFQNEKMTALGSLLAGVAHQLNNPLSVVVGHTLMLAEETADPAVRRQVQKISEAAERCTRIVRTFLGTARQSQPRRETADLNEIVSTAVDVVRHGESELEIRTVLEDGLPPVEADSEQIAHVVINLLLNADQAIQSSGVGGVISVHSRSAMGGRRVTVAVEDDGPGVPPEVRPRLFEPFFSTRDPSEATGMGLTHSHRILDDHGGTITFDPEFGTGARFVIELDAARHAVPDEPDTAGALAETARVLVIDDEPDVADLNAEVLERAGYAAEAAYTAEDAVTAMKTASYDAVISDLNMPGLDGRGFFEVIQRDFPDMLPNTGFVTGDTMGQASQSFLRESQRPYLEKPVSPSELRTFVADLVAAEVGA